MLYLKKFDWLNWTFKKTQVVESEISAKYLFENIVQKLNGNEDKHQKNDSNEKKAIAYILIENFFNLSRTDIIIDKKINSTKRCLKQIDEAVARIVEGEPVQYVIESAYFYGREFCVNKATLIPRRETEELVDLIIKENLSKKLKILDIGTGSGCIAVTLAREISNSEVLGIDISEEALQVAEKNATLHEANIKFYKEDIFKPDFFSQFGNKFFNFDIIVSNPPYVRKSETQFMEKNVINYEPYQALFVSDENPLVFYQRIIEMIKSGNKSANQSLLKNEGKLYFEINEAFGSEIASLLTQNNFTKIRLIKDLQGKERIVTGILNLD